MFRFPCLRGLTLCCAATLLGCLSFPLPGSAQSSFVPFDFSRVHASDADAGKPAPARQETAPDAQSTDDRAPGYHWRGLIWQSAEFDIEEIGFRVTSDSTIRDLLVHKPYWHDWLASMQQWNMRRWSDGDDFLVDDVGHPMQGAVSAFIEIQNSPTDSRLEWGQPGYRRSRFLGFLWATAFSTQQKISPVGEAGIGNDGGFTYGNQCFYHCTDFGPKDKYTNNTGWTDLVITPVVGTFWVVAEDVLDKQVSDRLNEAYPDKLWPKIVRGGLNPARTFANGLRWHSPWYRDFEHGYPEAQRVHFFHSDEQEAWSTPARFQLAPYLTGASLAANTVSCFNCRQTAAGVGLEESAHLRGWLSFDSAVSYHPNASPLPSDRAGGNLLVAAFGLRATRDWHYYAAHIAVRPALVHFDRAYLTSPETIVITTSPPGIGTSGADPASTIGPGVVDANGLPNEPKLGAITHFAWDFNFSGDYKIAHGIALRAGVSEDLVHYRTDKVNAPGIGVPPYLSWLSKQNFINRGSVSYQLGPVFSF